MQSPSPISQRSAQRKWTRWSQQAYVKAINAQAGDGGAGAVALSVDGNTLAIGARGEDSNATGIDGNQSNDDLPNSGAVYVFRRGGTRWSPQSYVKVPNPPQADAQFGGAVALSSDGKALAVGAPNESSSAIGVGGPQDNDLAAGSGAVYVYR